MVFLTNNVALKATNIAILYKSRRGIELILTWIKQLLKIKFFWGHSEIAVKTQVWKAISVYVLAAIAKKWYMLNQSLYEILQVVSISIVERIPIQ